MNGKQHSKTGIGAAVGTFAVVYKLTGDVTTSTLTSAIVYPMVALPDIDHNATKLGRTRTKVNKGIAAAAVGGLAISAFAAYQGYCDRYIPGVLLALIVAYLLFSKTSLFKQMFKHRGVTHTIFFPALFLAIGNYFGGAVWWVSVGIAIGCITHDIGDACTTEGWSPLGGGLNIHLLKIPSKNSGALDTVSVILAIVLAAAGIFISTKL